MSYTCALNGNPFWDPTQHGYAEASRSWFQNWGLLPATQFLRGTAYQLGATERWRREWGEWFDPYPEPILTLAEPLSLAKPVCSQHEQCKGCGCEKYDRRLVELFCSENSALGRRTKESIGCDVVRVHERMDMNPPVSQQNAINALSTPNACAWISAPVQEAHGTIPT